MKFLQAYLSEDIDANQSNTGAVERIWVNPDCADPNSCRDGDVSFFELVDPTAANERLNSQALEISAGTYRYVKIDFCIGSAQGPNVSFKTDAMASVKEVTYGGCGVTSAKLDPPLELKGGESVTIALDYDLNDGELYFVNGSESCPDATHPCLGGVELTPRVVR